MTFLRIAALFVAPFFLTSCFLVPGLFDAEMTIGRDGNFAFSYAGQIRVGLDDNGAKPRAEELASEAKSGESEDMDLDAAMNQGFAEMAEQLMGGLDPRDEEAVRAFAAQLEEREGWKRVEYRGNGLFDVDYAITGNLTHDFAFPVVPDFILNFPMFTAVPKDDGTIAVRASALMPAPNGADGDEDRPRGSFTLRTDAAVVESVGGGAASEEAGRTVLRWDSEEQRTETPEAVISLGA